jgi:hypothetical protein
MTVWHFTGGSHFTQRDLSADPPPDPPPQRQFDDFAKFFQTAPALRRAK